MNDLLTWEQARRYLGVSRDKMSKLIKAERIETRHDPLDQRRRLIVRASVEALKAQTLPRNEGTSNG